MSPAVLEELKRIIEDSEVGLGSACLSLESTQLARS